MVRRELSTGRSIATIVPAIGRAVLASRVRRALLVALALAVLGMGTLASAVRAGGGDDTFTEVSGSPNPSFVDGQVTVVARECDRTRTVHPTGDITLFELSSGTQLGAGTLGSSPFSK